MIDLLLLLIFNALIIAGLWLSTGQDMIFERPARWLEERVPEWWLKPLFGCPTCMASVHSILPYWLSHDYSTEALIIYLLYIPALAALATFVTNKIDE